MVDSDRVDLAGGMAPAVGALVADPSGGSEACVQFGGAPVAVSRSKRRGLGGRILGAHVALAIIERCQALCQLALASFAFRQSRTSTGAEEAGAAPLCPAPSIDPYLVRRLGRLEHEALICLYYREGGAFLLDRAHAGNPGAVDFDRQALLRGVFERKSRYVVMAHNHPSGDARPSRADIDATRQAYRLFAALGIALVDHVIVARGGDAFSFRAEGLL